MKLIQVYLISMQFILKDTEIWSIQHNSVIFHGGKNIFGDRKFSSSPNLYTHPPHHTFAEVLSDPPDNIMVSETSFWSTHVDESCYLKMQIMQNANANNSFHPLAYSKKKFRKP